MFNTYVKLFPDGCQVNYYHFKEFPDASHFISPEKLQSRSEYNTLNRTRTKIYDYARCNDFKYFVTLTFNPELVDSFDIDASYKAMHLWLMHTRVKFPELKYLGVPELHKSGRFHFHFLMSSDIESVLLDSGKRDKGHVIYNVGSYRKGWSTAIELYDKEKVPSYMVKYITKDLKERSPNKKRYWASRNLALPECHSCFLDFESFGSAVEGFDVRYSSSCSNEFVVKEHFDVSYDGLGFFLDALRKNSEKLHLHLEGWKMEGFDNPFGL